MLDQSTRRLVEPLEILKEQDHGTVHHQGCDEQTRSPEDLCAPAFTVEVPKAFVRQMSGVQSDQRREMRDDVWRLFAAGSGMPRRSLREGGSATLSHRAPLDRGG